MPFAKLPSERPEFHGFREQNLILKKHFLHTDAEVIVYDDDIIPFLRTDVAEGTLSVLSHLCTPWALRAPIITLITRITLIHETHTFLHTHTHTQKCVLMMMVLYLPLL